MDDIGVETYVPDSLALEILGEHMEQEAFCLLCTALHKMPNEVSTFGSRLEYLIAIHMQTQWRLNARNLMTTCNGILQFRHRVFLPVLLGISKKITQHLASPHQKELQYRLWVQLQAVFTLMDGHSFPGSRVIEQLRFICPIYLKFHLSSLLGFRTNFDSCIASRCPEVGQLHGKLIVRNWNFYCSSFLQYLIETERYQEASDHLRSNQSNLTYINHPDAFGNIALHYAVRKCEGMQNDIDRERAGGPDKGKLLFDLFIHLFIYSDVTKQNALGISPMMMFLRGCKTLCSLHQLLAHRAFRQPDNLCQVCSRGDSLLHWCFEDARQGNHFLFAALATILQRASEIACLNRLITMKNNRGQTALMISARHGFANVYISFVKTAMQESRLPEAEAANLMMDLLTAEDERFWTYIDYAVHVGNQDVQPTPLTARQTLQLELYRFVMQDDASKVHSIDVPAVFAIDALEVMEKLGEQGRFGAVSTGVYQGRDVIVKEVAVSASQCGRGYIEKPKELAFNETRSSVQSPRPLITGFAHKDDIENGPFYLVMNRAPGITLRKYIESDDMEKTRARVALSLAGALSEFHAAGLVHRDLHEGNVMVSIGDGKAAGDTVVSIIDYGFSTSEVDPEDLNPYSFASKLANVLTNTLDNVARLDDQPADESDKERKLSTCSAEFRRSTPGTLVDGINSVSLNSSSGDFPIASYGDPYSAYCESSFGLISAKSTNGPTALRSKETEVAWYEWLVRNRMYKGEKLPGRLERTISMLKSGETPQQIRGYSQGWAVGGPYLDE